MNLGQLLVLLLLGLPYVALNLGMLFCREKTIELHVRMAMALGVPEEEARRPRYKWWVHWLAGAFIAALFVFFGWPDPS